MSWKLACMQTGRSQREDVSEIKLSASCPGDPFPGIIEDKTSRRVDTQIQHSIGLIVDCSQGRQQDRT